MGRHSAPRPRRRHTGLMTALGAVLLVAGLAFTFYPVFSASMAQQEANDALAAWRAEGAVNATIVEDPTTGETFRAKEGDATYEQLAAYNEEVAAGTGDAVNDPFAFSGDDLAALGLPDGIVGSITIERFGETIPLYLGASSEHLAQGAAVLAGTSMPLGGEGAHCVIAAHRGAWSGLTMFRDVETLEVGDLVRIETPWDQLCYRVTGFEVILPNDTGAFGIEPDRDLLTLLTCHPYGENHHRILVRCERDRVAEADVAGTAAGGAFLGEGLVARIAHAVWPGWSAGSPLLNVESILRVTGVGITLALGMWLIVDSVRARVRERARGRAPGCGQHMAGTHRRR